MPNLPASLEAPARCERLFDSFPHCDWTPTVGGGFGIIHPRGRLGIVA